MTVFMYDMWLVGCLLGAIWCTVIWVMSRLIYGSWPRLDFAELLSIFAVVVLFWPVVMLVVIGLAVSKISKDS